MAGQNIGFLNFGIDGDDKELKKKLEALNKDAVTLEKVLKDIKIGTSASSLSKEIQKAQLDTDKLAISTNKVARSEEELNNAKRRGITLEEQATNAKKQGLNLEARLINEKKRSVLLDNQSKQSSEATALAAQRRVNAEIDAINKKARAQQQEMINAARLEGIHKRNALIGAKSVSDVNRELSKQGNIIDSLTKRAAAYFSVYKVAQFAKEIVTVRGELEGLEVAFETMLGTADKSAKMMSEITTMALQTPYTVKDVADNVKQLIAMGIEADKVMDTMKSLGDVSAGLSVPMWRIAINYGQVATLGRLQQREIRDFAMAGVPIMEALADVLGKTKSEITSMVTAGKVGFPAVEEAFRRMAGEGGKFHNMMQKRNSTMLGQLNRLQDQIQLMMNELGKSNSGAIYSAIGAASTLVENYEAVGKTMLALVSTYGTYKAILIGVRAVEQARVAIAITQLSSTTALTTAQTAQVLSTNALSFAFSRLNRIIMNNPYMLAATAIVGMGWALYEVYNTTTALEDAQKRLEVSQGNLYESIAATESELSTYNDKLIDVKDNEEEFKKVKDAIVAKYGQYYEGLDGEIERVKDLSTSYETLTGILTENLAKRELLAAKDEEEARFSGVRAKNMAELRKRLIADFDKEEASRLYKEVSDYIYRNIELTPDTEKTLKQTGMWGFGGQLYKYIRDIKDEAAATKIVLDGLDDMAKQYNTTLKSTKKDESKEPEPIYGVDYKAAKEAWENAKKELDKIEKDKDNYTREQWEKAKENEEIAKKAFEALGGETKRTPTRNFKDPLVDKLEKRIEIFKKAKTEFDKLSKSMDSNSAYAKLVENPAFSNISQFELSSDGFMTSIDKFISEVSKLKASDERDKLLANLFSLKNDTAAKLAKDSMDAIERELSKYKDKYNLYETLLGITGDEEQSRRLVFGGAEAVVKSYKERLKEAIEQSEDKEFKKKLQDQLFSLETSDSTDFLKDMGSLLKKYQSIEDKISKIKLDGIRERQRISDAEARGEIDTDLASQAINASIEKQKELIAALENESLKLTPFYQKLFGDINSYGIRMLNSLIDKTKEVVDTAKSTGKNMSGLYTIEIDGESVSLTEADLARLIKQLGVLEKKVTQNNPFSALADSVKEYKSVMSNEDSTEENKTETISKLGVAVGNAGKLVQELSGDFAALFDAMGFQDTAETISFIGELTNSLTQLGEGLATSNPVQAVQGLIGAITSIFNFRDKRLSRSIEKSQIEVKKLQTSYEELSRVISRQLGAATEKQTKEQIDNLKKQQEELKKQERAESKKKKKDKQAIEDYKNSINELEDQIKYFYEDLFNEQYGFDLKSIADQLSSSLVEAFSKGEDAAAAFDNTVASIMRNVISNMIKLDVIEPALKKVREYLFGDKGVFNDGEFSVSDAKGLVGVMGGLKDSIGQGKQIWDALNEAAKQAGIDLSEAGSSAKDTFSKGIQAVTEDTANLLASYINAIRSDVSITKEQIIAMTEYSRLNNTTLGDMLLVLKNIEVNTFNTAGNTKDISDTVKMTHELLKSATIKNGVTGWNLL